MATVRLYWSPIIGDGQSRTTAYRPSLTDAAGVRVRNVMPSQSRYTVDGDANPDAGKPSRAATIAVARALDWTAVDLDATQVLLLPDIGAPDGPTLLAALQAKTVADIPVLYRTRWTSTVLSSLGVRVDDIVGTTPIIRLVRRVLYALDPSGAFDEAFFA